MDLYTTMPMLVELRCTFYWNSARVRRTLSPLVFAARITLDTKVAFLHSIDAACLQQVRDSTRYVSVLGRAPIIDYEVERYFVWSGFHDDRLPISSVPEREFRNQLDLVEKRGYRDWIRVDMALEIEAPDVEGGGLDGGRKAEDLVAHRD
ncbi:hypothetical protein QBC33DRAFT_598227 [Phialemonium atrogriseum]|uniref:Uncharacterized protein n=1 Tax=Phialemonium atrogriseum TaxID=1093897 RepID=A0AAJ0BS07_9PEZI|nr:uncharacterized protein QBC33DRAFT_598227 [Phialemonium atrogriseum]KAK1763415.1 hypothetical protein QBC33DRAFT_598227 [Phialemonium atrogriseum]